MSEVEGLLVAEDIHKTFRGPGRDLEILRGVNLTLGKGQLYFILGRSGAGKSTLLHILAGLDQPTGGTVTFRGKTLASMKDSELARYRNRNLGFVFQLYYLLPELSLLENVMLPSWIGKEKVDKKAALFLLRRVGLENRACHFPSQLSGGEQQRAAIARALVNEPDIVFCDEPTGNLDEETAGSVFDLVLNLNRNEGQTFVIVTHEENLIQQNCPVYYLHEGRLSLKR